MNKILSLIILPMILAATAGCHSVDDDRIPPVDVYIPFNSQPEWTVYGVSGACSHKRFIKQDRIPADFPYPAMSYTGYGGVLLCTDIHGTPVAYDLACPVEVNPTVRVVINSEKLEAECPVCHSTYDVFANNGIPTGGVAASDGYALRRYRVGAGASGQYMIVTR